ncbi:hypothetical protein TIFTF001_049588 [Ficus carica]|uniref:DUF8040 domain-containing protein n=1 Tax=Ficus carica TaxID=3494 RepID=A0AA88CTZ9_FICCA|nr:hypothetical protein TIFTF001_049588 [Ficus carica]
MNEHSSASEKEDEYIEDDRYATMAVVAVTAIRHARRRDPQPMHNSRLTGSMRVEEILNGHHEICQALISMKAETFRSLSDLLERRELLKPTRNMDVNEQLFIFLSICAQGATNRQISYLFQHSRETTSRWFYTVLQVICSLKDEFIRPPDYTAVQHLIEEHSYKYRPWMMQVGDPCLEEYEADCVSVRGNVDVNADYELGDGIDETGSSTGTQQEGSRRCAMNQLRDMMADNMRVRYQLSPWYKTT